MERPALYQVLPADDFKVYLYYDNGEIKLYDCSFILEESGVYDEIKDISRFKELCTIMNGTLAFDISEQRDPFNCIDFCPDVLYCESVESDDAFCLRLFEEYKADPDKGETISLEEAAQQLGVTLR